MPTTLRLSRTETLLIRESTADRFEVDATYEPGGARPPRHSHPHHDESFTVLEGTLRVGIGVGAAACERDYVAGDSFDIPCGTVHHMWNPTTEPATARWLSSPAGRVASYFTAIDRLQTSGRAGRPQLAAVLRDHPDVMQPASRLTRAAVRLLAPLGRRFAAPGITSGSRARRYLATALTGALSLGIGYVGVSYLLAPGATAPSFGMATWPTGAEATFLVTKGARDLVSGLIPLVLLLAGQRRALGLVLVVESLVPALDASLILATGGSTATALAVHGITAILVLGTGLLLLTEPAAEPTGPDDAARMATTTAVGGVR